MNNAFDSRVAHSGSAARAIDQGLRRYMLGVFNYMGSGLVLSGILALLTFSNQSVMAAVWGTPLGLFFQFGPLVMLIGVMFVGRNMSIPATQAFYWVFVSLMGVSLSYWGMVYTGESIARTLFITGATFGAMSLWGYTTKRELTGLRSFLFMGLIGIIIAAVVNIFMQSAMMHFIISAIGVLIFTLMTAYDTQQQKSNYYALKGNSAELHRSAIWGALGLYLNFINLFQFLLAFFGQRE